MLSSILAAVAACALGARASPLWDYVNDPATKANYSYVDTGYKINGTAMNNVKWTANLLNVTSGHWITPEYSDNYLWTHQALVVVPENVQSTDHAAVYVTGGDNHDGNPGPDSEDVLFCVAVASIVGTPCTTLWQIPNQPIHFAGDPSRGRGEDAAVAYTWADTLNRTRDGLPYEPERILYFPMTRAVSRTMDATTDYLTKTRSLSPSKFLISGASKRGWITWLTGATDSRVVAIAPIVMDLMHFKETINHMHGNYGGFTFAFKDYCDEGVTSYLNQPELPSLTSQIDVVNYLDNITMPALVIDATGDEFFQDDDDYTWWSSVASRGNFYRLMVSNAEHSFATGVIALIDGLTPFWQSVVADTPRPEISWTIENDTGVINILSKQKPDKVVIRTADTLDSKRRDFRLVRGNTPADPCEPQGIPVNLFGDACIVPIFWIGEDVGASKVDADGYHYELSADLPPDGKWRAFLGELYFPSPKEGIHSFALTTQISIIPQTRPYGDCSGNCSCILV